MNREITKYQRDIRFMQRETKSIDYEVIYNLDYASDNPNSAENYASFTVRVSVDYDKNLTLAQAREKAIEKAHAGLSDLLPIVQSDRFDENP